MNEPLTVGMLSRGAVFERTDAPGKLYTVKCVDCVDYCTPKDSCKHEWIIVFELTSPGLTCERQIPLANVIAHLLTGTLRPVKTEPKPHGA